MVWQVIEKPQGNWRVQPNLLSYERTCADYSWQKAEEEFVGSASRGLNIGYECVDRHAQSARGAHLALRWLSKDGEVRDFSYVDLQRLSNRFANVLGASASAKVSGFSLSPGGFPSFTLLRLEH
jgi:acetyl-CoA synthetase